MSILCEKTPLVQAANLCNRFVNKQSVEVTMLSWTSKSSKSFTKLKNKVFLSSSFNKWLSLQLNSEENSVWLFFSTILCRISLCVSIHTIKMMRQPENPSLRKLQIVHLEFPKRCGIWCRSSLSGGVFAEPCSWPNTFLLEQFQMPL